MKLFRISLAFAILSLIAACKSDSNEPQKPLIERNKEVREYIDVLSELVYEFCVLMRKTVDKAAEIDEKEENGEEATFMDGLEMLGNMATSAFKINQLSEEIEDLEAQQKDFKRVLSTSDYQEFMRLYTEHTECFYELSKKAEELEN